MLGDDERAELIRAAAARPARHDPDVTAVHHFSEDPHIRRFEPHVPATNPMQRPGVWAIDAEHAPVYWFPRDCPRVSVWASTPDQRDQLAALFDTDATRVSATESGWRMRVTETRLYRYDFDAAAFESWPEADGQYVARRAVTAHSVEPVRDLIRQHASAGFEMRFTPTLHRLGDLILASGLPFSLVRMANATPR